jgi:hemolysin activation/secretion protein
MTSLYYIFTTILLLLTGMVAIAQDAWSALENRKLIISHIDIRILPVFDLQNPKEDHFIARWANFIHVQSKEKTIRPALLFNEGDPANEMQIHASERLLRSLPFIQDAEIIPSENPDGTVTAIVIVQDAWSLKLSLALSHVGGVSEWSATIKEYNFLGFGKQIQIGYQKTIDRTFTDFAYQDPFLFNRRWLFYTEYKKLSDGTALYGMLNHPFYDVHTPWSAGIAANTRSFIQTIYEKSKPVYNMDYDQYSFSLFYHFLVWKQDRAAQRFGLEGRISGYRHRLLTVFQPEVLPLFEDQERRFQGFLGFWEFFQDDYITRRNVNYIGKVEDFNLGWDAQIRLGYYPQSLGSSGNAVYGEGFIAKGIAFDKKSFLLGNILWQNTNEVDTVNHFWSQSNLTFYSQQLPLQTFLLSFQFIHSIHPFPEDVTYLGGSDGLRGYMNHFRNGDQRWMLTLEDRVFTPWNFLGLIELGFVSYLDVGGVRELSTGHWSKTYASIGAGLRIGNLKSSFGRVITLTVATPIVREPGVEKIQIVIGAGR